MGYHGAEFHTRLRKFEVGRGQVPNPWKAEEKGEEEEEEEADNDDDYDDVTKFSKEPYRHLVS